MSQYRLSRRSLLAGLGLGTAAAFVPLLDARKALAAPGDRPPNLITIAWPNGCVPFWPDGEGSTYTIPQYEDCPTKPLTAWKDRLLFLGGLDMQNLRDENRGGGHAGMPFVFTGVRGAKFDGTISDGLDVTAGGPSLDYYLADRIAKAEGKTALQRMLVQRAHRLNGDDIFLSFAGAPIAGKPNAVQPYDNPVELFDKMFKIAAADPEAMKRLRAERKSVLDYVGKSLTSTCKRLGTEDRLKCEQHLTAVREYEQAAAIVACSQPSEPLRNADYLKESANPLVPEIHKLQMGMLVTALACGMVRTGSLQWCSSHNNQYHFSWLKDKDPAFAGGSVNPEETGGGPSAYLQHHEIAHNDGRTPAHTRRKNFVDQWFVQQVADLMQRLFDVKEVGGTLLDRTMILLVNLQRTGGGHQLDDLPVLLAGNANGYFKTGRHLRWTSGTPGTHLPLNALYTEICNAMGFPHDKFGAYAGSLPTLRA